jgi:transposase InsO family protein
MLPSMSKPANPYDNARCESFLKTLKREEIHASTYGDFEVLRERMGTSPYPAMKMIGISDRSTATRSCRSRPLRHGRETSRTKHLESFT